MTAPKIDLPMHKPPFRPASSAVLWSQPATPWLPGTECCGDAAHEPAHPEPTGRARLADLDPHLHCSVIGTCLSTAELRRLMARFIEVDGEGDLEVHHEAVRRASTDPATSRALHKALDQRHDATLQRFNQARDDGALAALWDDALRRGDVPGAYWAVLTHRRATNALRQRAFGEVHMLSHLVGASNRADLRRLVAIEQENTELRQRAERQQARLAELTEEREAAAAVQRDQAAEIERLRAQIARLQQANPGDEAGTLQVVAATVALQTERRERAESAAMAALADARRLERELDHLHGIGAESARELAAAETQLRELAGASHDPGAFVPRLSGRRLLYVGGRPSSGPAIRDLVLRHGGELQRHDGGIEDRKGLLASAIAWADTVVFPVDCIDHDSALALKRLCGRQGTAFVALRSASVTSFAAGVLDVAAASSPARCQRHG